MRFDQITVAQRSLLLSPVAFHREHYARLMSHLEAQSVPADDRLFVAVAKAKEAVDSLLFLLAERPGPGLPA
jgi:hypothetical protein